MTWARAYGASLGGTAALAPVFRRTALSLGLVTRPRSDRWNTVPTPLLGGPAMLGAITAAASMFPGRRERIPLLCGAWTALALGLRDDFCDLGPRDKILGLAAAWGVEQVAAAWLETAAPAPLASTAQGGIDRPTRLPAWADQIESLLMAVAGANLFNLSDNMDGAAAGLLAVTAGAALPLTPDPVLPACLAGSCLGYLGCNAYPSALLMGDAGSLPLGYLAGRLASTVRPRVCALLLLGVPAADTLAVLVTRAMGRRSLFRGSTDHLTHRLARIGIPEPLPALLLCMIQAGMGASAVVLAGREKPAPARSLAAGLPGPIGENTPTCQRLWPLLFTAAAAVGVMTGRRLVSRRMVVR